MSNLDTPIKGIYAKYSTGEGKLSPKNVRGLKKVEILSLLDEQKKEIDDVLKNNDFSTLYKIVNLSSEYLSPLKKKEISYAVEK